MSVVSGSHGGTDSCLNAVRQERRPNEPSDRVNFSRHHLLNYVPLDYAREPLIESRVEVSELVVIQTHQVQDRRVQV
jgi:hypothetical protein